jgi:DNA processing protein
MSDLRPWLALKSVPGVGNLLFRRLVERFGAPEFVFQADRSELLAVQGITPRLIQAIRSHDGNEKPIVNWKRSVEKGYKSSPRRILVFRRCCWKFPIRRLFCMYMDRCRLGA